MMEIVIGIAALVVGLASGYALAARNGTKIRTDLALERARSESLKEREESLRAEHARYVEQIKGDHQALREQFQALSSEALKANQESFLQIANERLTRAQQSNQEELAKREAAVKQLVEPMAKALEDVKKQTTEADRARAETQAQLTEQIRRMLDTSETLGRQTESLRSALRRPEVRGRWGELHLKRVVEVAGLVNGVDFA